jgi:hypothetical protein
MTPPAAPARSSRPADRADAVHNRSPSRWGILTSAVPTPPTAARAASWRPSGASAGTTMLVSRSTTLVVERAASTLNPMETPASREVRGIQRRPKGVQGRDRLQRRRWRRHHRVQPSRQPPRPAGPVHITHYGGQSPHHSLLAGAVRWWLVGSTLSLGRVVGAAIIPMG